MKKVFTLGALLLGTAIGGAAAQTAGGPASAGPGAMPTQTPLGGGPSTPPPTEADKGATTTAATPTQPSRVVRPGDPPAK